MFASLNAVFVCHDTNVSGGIGGGKSQVSDDDAVQRAATGPEQARRSRRHEEEPAGQVRAAETRPIYHVPPGFGSILPLAKNLSVCFCA